MVVQRGVAEWRQAGRSRYGRRGRPRYTRRGRRRAVARASGLPYRERPACLRATVKKPRVSLHGYFTYFVLQSNPAFPKLAPMPTRSEAEEHLRVIRSLMEKATIYRAISAPTALVGGLLSVAVAAVGAWWHGQLFFDISNHEFRFFWPWIAVLAVTTFSNAWFLYRDARRRGEVFLSPGMRLAARCMAPSFLSAGVLAFLSRSTGDGFVVFIWMLFYGLGLLSTLSFAPSSIAVLGWTFLAGAFALIAFPSLPGSGPLSLEIRNAHLLMGSTFGLFHLIYAACTWPRKSSAADSGVEP